MELIVSKLDIDMLPLLPFCTIYHADDEYLHKTGEGSVLLINAATGTEREFVNQQIFVRHFPYHSVYHIFTFLNIKTRWCFEMWFEWHILNECEPWPTLSKQSDLTISVRSIYSTTLASHWRVSHREAPKKISLTFGTVLFSSYVLLALFLELFISPIRSSAKWLKCKCAFALILWTYSSCLSLMLSGPCGSLRLHGVSRSKIRLFPEQLH